MAADAADIAGRLIDAFGSLSRLLAAQRSAIDRLLDDGGATATVLESMRDMLSEATRVEVEQGDNLSSSVALERYLRLHLAPLDHEQVRVLFLNARNMLLRDELMFRGTVNGTRVYPREIMKRALELGSTAIILVHNHPSGDPEPSLSDIVETRRICEAASALDIMVHDHIVVGRFGLTSFRARGLLPLGTQQRASANDAGPVDHSSLASFARSFRAAHLRVGGYFDADLFASPALDILLDLFVAGETHGKAVDSTEVAETLPQTTVTRWLNELAARGMVSRNVGAGGALAVRLSPSARGAMRSYVASIASLPLVITGC